MPGFTTHYLLGSEVRREIAGSTLSRAIEAHPAVYQLGLQGPDIFFYNVPLARHRNHRNIGIHMHEAHISDFYRQLFRRIERLSDPAEKELAAAYTAGFMSHYIGDYVIHPYIYARIEYDPKLRGKAKSRTLARHAQLENDIDALLLYDAHKKKPSEFNQAASIQISKEDTVFLSALLSRTITTAYYPYFYDKVYTVTGGVVARSIWATRIGCRTLSDPLAKKQRRIKAVETLLRRHPVISNKLVTDTVENAKWALNADHTLWANPWDRSLVSDADFQKLYERARAECRRCFLLFSELLEHPAPWEAEKTAALIEALGNFSFHSGLPTG